MKLSDVAVGLCALIAVLVLSLFTGGFNFFLPWIFWGTLLLFAAGFWRARYPEVAVWRTVVSINLCWLVLTSVVMQGNRWGVELIALGTCIPTTAGALARRLLMRRRLRDNPPGLQ
ncbi:MAG: hypothetical protein ABSB86_06635 [Bryobacteraceae bacterium]|jgi:phosphotransferase system  glucose/maltose/N-acetylglucosamine-specific IIC component